MYCTKCGTQVDDSAAFCTRCGAPVNGNRWTANESIPSASGLDNLRRPKIPGITLAACIILYLYGGGALLSTLSNDYMMPGVTVFVSALYIFSIGCTVLAQAGRNWARIVLTTFYGLMFLLAPLSVLRGIPVDIGTIIVSFIVISIFALPIVFLWLPRSNNWYRAIKACSK